jgi:transcriptional regulator with XRE-family HTH domain
MAARKSAPETFADLLDKCVPGERWEDFAGRAGVSSRTVWRMRSGVSTLPFRDTVAKLAKALGVEPSRVRAAIQASRNPAGR